MSALVFEHVPVADLPATWRARLAETPGATVTVRIEAENADTAGSFVNDPLFGMWQDRDDMADVAGYLRSVRDDRFSENTPGRD